MKVNLVETVLLVKERDEELITAHRDLESMSLRNIALTSKLDVFKRSESTERADIQSARSSVCNDCIRHKDAYDALVLRKKLVVSQFEIVKADEVAKINAHDSAVPKAATDIDTQNSSTDIIKKGTRVVDQLRDQNAGQRSEENQILDTTEMTINGGNKQRVNFQFSQLITD